MSEKYRIAFIVNGLPGSAMDIRARSFAERLRGSFDIHIAHRTGGKITAMFRFFVALLKFAPRCVYVFDIGFSGTIAALCYQRITHARFVVDTGDPIYELGRGLGRVALGLTATRLLEESALEAADFIIVRGTRHKNWLKARGFERVEVIQDGVDTVQFAPENADDVRRDLKLESTLVVGLIGSSMWSERYQMCYGWDLVEALGRIKDAPIKGFMIGGGDGIGRLKARCAELGIADKMVFLGFVPYEKLPYYIGAMDVCLSTQSNDLVGQFRTTGKLPLYLSCGKYVLASRVGEAELVLEPEMTIQYEGVKDESYPAKLAAKLLDLSVHPEDITKGAAGVGIARRVFDYDVLCARLKNVLISVLS
ncbi:MAG: hypothetical protein WCT04_20220 [Planctomycetota bacterium]